MDLLVKDGFQWNTWRMADSEHEQSLQGYVCHQIRLLTDWILGHWAVNWTKFWLPNRKNCIAKKKDFLLRNVREPFKDTLFMKEKKKRKRLLLAEKQEGEKKAKNFSKGNDHLKCGMK